MKKVLALVLVAVMAFGMASVGFAASTTSPKAKGLWADNISYGYGYDYVYEQLVRVDENNHILGYSVSDGRMVQSGKGRIGSLNKTLNTASYDFDVVPHDKVKDYINLFVGMFEWGNDGGYRILPDYAMIPVGDWDWENNRWAENEPHYVGNPYELITGADIRNSKIAVRTSVKAGSKAVDSVSIVNKDGVIEIKYVEEFISTKELDFDFTVYLVIDGKRYNDQGLTFIGTLANPITEVYADDDYVDLSYGQVAEAMEFVKEIEVDLGNGISIFTKFFKTKKYYGTCTRDADEHDDIVFAKYPDVDNVVTLKTVGLNSTGDIVKMSTDYSDYYVYDANMNYLGQSNQMLPYSTKYYLANKKLDVTDSSISEEPGDAPTGDALNPNTGGDDLPSKNPNGNPSTGR